MESDTIIVDMVLDVLDVPIKERTKERLQCMASVALLCAGELGWSIPDAAHEHVTIER